MIDWIALDADDTLWRNEEYYLDGRDQFFQILEKYDFQPEKLAEIGDFEVDNIPYFGYGAMSFILSMIELAIEITENRIHPGDIQQIIQLGKEMLTHEVILFPGVEELLESLSSVSPLMLITKGDLFHQQRKFKESGLDDHFQALEVVSEKDPSVYQEILQRYKIQPERFLMIGNSLRSDIVPILELGGWALHLTDHPTWAHEDDPLAKSISKRFLEVEGIPQVYDCLLEAGLVQNK
jgi:putative hydrolase of the HAD superfamily